MSLGAWVLVVVIGVPLLAALIWLVVRESVVRVPAGSLGILVVRGKSTDRSLLPGIHWVPALRKRQCITYPAVELSYRAGGEGGRPSPVEMSGPMLHAVLGDRAEARIGYTLRFRLDPEHLRIVHDRFGTSGYWSAVRDTSETAIADALVEDDVTLDSFYPGERVTLEAKLKQRLTDALAAEGILLSGFGLGAADLGRAGETIQATVRARLELAREQAEAAMQKQRVLNDAALAESLAEVGDAAIRYRQTEVLRDLAHRPEPMRLWVEPPLTGEPSVYQPAESPTDVPAEAGGVQ